MIKKMENNCLFSFGCSHMYGWEHKSTENNTKPSDDVYTNLLAKHYNLKHFNFAEGGSSNQGIIRQVVFAQEFEKDQNLNSVYWIQWSGFERLELPLMSSKKICKNWPYVQVDGELKNKSNSALLNRWANSLYRSMDDLALFVLSANAIIQVNSMLLAKNKKVINCFAHTWDLECAESTYYIKEKDKKNVDTMYNQILYSNYIDKKENDTDTNLNENIIVGKSGKDYKNFDPYTKRLWSLIKTYNWHHWDKVDTGFKSWSIENNYGTHPEGHPTEKAHQEAFNLILKNKTLEK